jgi:hypothetical protein
MSYWYVYATGCIDPDARGPFATEAERDEAARKAAHDGDREDDVVFWLDVGPDGPTIGAYSGAFFEDGMSP